MKKVVWLNRSNGQLCATIPKDSGIKEGDIVSIEKQKIKTIVWTSVTVDGFHYGHLRLLQYANKLGDFHVCGVLTDEAMASYREKPLAGLRERLAIISDLRCVDMVVVQKDLDPTENLRELHERFPHAKLVAVYGSNWKKVPGEAFIRKIKGEIVRPSFYDKLPAQHVQQAPKRMKEKAVAA